MDYRVYLIFGALTALGIFFLHREGLMQKPLNAAGCILLLLGAMALRACFMDYETLDYQNFLTRWVQFYRDNGGFKALDRSVGNYNIPYLYFMALFSYSSIKDLYLIKLLSIFFDLLLAWGCVRVLGSFTRSVPRRIACFFTVLYLPTVFLNSSVWAQCDAVYVAFGVLGIALALEDRPVESMVMMALSFGFKLQAVFILPVCAVLWLKGKYKLWHFLVFPLSYVILVMPAVIAGRPVIETLTLYTSQTGSIGNGLNYNSPSVFAVITDVSDTDRASKIAILCAFAFMLLVLLAAFLMRKRLSNTALMVLAAIFAVGIPFILPHMHDRYFFAADILTLLLAFILPITAPLAALTQFASLLGYHAYLKMRYLLLMDRGACALILVLCCLFITLFECLRKKNIADDEFEA